MSCPHLLGHQPPQSQPGPSRLTPGELIAAVKKTPLDDSEAQRLIDVILNKQGGGGGDGGDWVDTSKGSHTNEVKNLQRQLEEKKVLLEEEAARTKSITDRMNLLRQELNQAKSQVSIVSC